MLKSVNPQSVLISSPVAGHILDAKKQSNKQIEIKKKNVKDKILNYVFNNVEQRTTL